MALKPNRQVPWIVVSLFPSAALWAGGGCREGQRAPVSQPAAAPPVRPAAEPGEPSATASPLATSSRRVRPAAPRRPKPSWIIFREALDPAADASIDCRWTGGNRLEVHTENVTRITLDLTKLPPGAPRTGPWNLQLDRQGISITGVRGKVLDLVRSENGIWSVDRDKSPRRR